MKTIIYTGTLGPDTVTFGVAGQFTRGVATIVEDDAVADQLLAKGYFEEVLPLTGKAAKNTAAAIPQEG